jgi:hypothetical protein
MGSHRSVARSSRHTWSPPSWTSPCKQEEEEDNEDEEEEEEGYEEDEDEDEEDEVYRQSRARGGREQNKFKFA